jgi:hypothetical protein
VRVLRRQRPGRHPLFSADRILWVWLYWVWPQILSAMVLVKPGTVVQWHRKGFRLYWLWRSRPPGRPKMGTEVRDLIRRMSLATPLWGPASTANCSSSALRSVRVGCPEKGPPRQLDGAFDWKGIGVANWCPQRKYFVGRSRRTGRPSQ